MFTTCHSGKLKPAFTSPDVISTSPKSFLTSRIDFTVFLFILIPQKNIPCSSGKLKTEFTSPIAKSTSSRLSDTTFFALCFKVAENTVQAVCEYICHLPNYGERKVAAHKLKLGQVKNILMKDFDCQVKFAIFTVSMAT